MLPDDSDIPVYTIYADPEDRRRTGKKLLYLLPGDARLGSVEELALAHFERSDGWLGFHCENSIFRMLFTLLFWDVIFAPISDVFQTPHQVAPLDITTAEAFFENRRDLFEARLSALSSGDGSVAQLLADSYYANYGSQAIGCHWEEYPLHSLLDITHAIGGKRLAPIMRHLAEDYAGHGSGMPDLLLYKADRSDIMLIEVKSTNDRLSDNQRCWHAVFRACGIPCKLLRVLDTNFEGLKEEEERRSGEERKKGKVGKTKRIKQQP
jgi:Fanconi-associated nuclease 1